MAAPKKPAAPAPAKQAPVQQAPAPKVKSVGIDNEPRTQSIFFRPLDFFFAAAYFLFALSQIVVLIVRCPELAPKQLAPVCPLFTKLEAPLSLAVHTYHDWSSKVFTAQSSFALEIAGTVNAFILAPVAIILGWSFLRGCSCAKNLALLHSAALLYSMTVFWITGSEALKTNKGAVKGGDVATFFGAVFGFYLFFPIAVIFRVWQEQPFANQTGAKKGGFLTGFVKSIIKLVFFAWLVFAALAYYEFAVKNVKAAKGYPSVADNAAETWKTIEPHVAEYTQGTLDTLSKVSQDALEQVGTYASKLGESVEDLLQKVTEGDKKK